MTRHETCSLPSPIGPCTRSHQGSGTEILSLERASDLPDAIVTVIDALLLHHKVLFFRSRHQLDDARHEQFAKRLGASVPDPTLAIVKGSASILELDSKKGGGSADR